MLIDILKKAIKRESWCPVLSYPIFLFRILICRLRYARILARIRQEADKNGVIRVLFLNMDVSKWKCQSLYEMMKANPHFEPLIGLTITEEDELHTPEQIASRNRDARVFYEKMGCKVVEMCDANSHNVIAPEDIGAEIVFFQVPWGYMGGQTVWNVSKYALCCYMPYSVEFIDMKHRSRRFDLHHMANFHLLLYASFQWSNAYADYYRSAMQPWEYAGCVYGFGHTSFDYYANSERADCGDEYIIFAPHFAFEYNGHKPVLNFGTFDWSGKWILSYAKNHPEQRWVFKPHPKLKERLIEIGYMSEAEVDAYYKEWERIGRSCYDGDYAKYFVNSFAMVTDSGSFLLEYMAVGKPLIRLVPKNQNTECCPAVSRLFDYIYIARNTTELHSRFVEIIEKHNDPYKEERMAVSSALNLFGNHTGRQIVDWLEQDVLCIGDKVGTVFGGV